MQCMQVIFHVICFRSDCEILNTLIFHWVPIGLCCQELEKKKQAEFEAQAKEMELKAAKERAIVASHPDILEVKERLDKLEMVLKDVVKSKTQVDNATKTQGEDQIKQNGAATAEQGNTPSELLGKPSIERGTAPSEEKTSKLAPDIHASQSNQKDSKR